MNFKAILFDLDGTLLDSLADIGGTMNHVLRLHGLREHGLETYKVFVGDGIETLIYRSLPEYARDQITLAECLSEYRAEYARRWNATSRLYDGIPELLDALRELKVPMSVLSNKSEDFTARIAAHYLARWPFAFVRGSRPDVPRKPDPSPAIAIAADMGLEPSDFLYCGDTSTDMQTAVSAGMHPVGVLWGFRDRDELVAAGARSILSMPMELLSL